MKTLLTLTLILIANVSFADQHCPSSEYKNPVFFGDQIVGNNGTSWKPRKRSVVIKLTAGVTKLFNRGCYVTNNIYGKEYLTYRKTDSNGRLTFKTDFSCENYESIEIFCEERKQEVLFKARKRKINKTCRTIR